jgi:hypothetical protein
MQEAGDHSRYAKADCHRKCPSAGSAKMGRISSLTNTDTHRLQANDCRAMDNGREFTDRLFGLRKRVQCWQHDFDRLCTELS